MHLLAGGEHEAPVPVPRGDDLADQTRLGVCGSRWRSGGRGRGRRRYRRLVGAFGGREAAAALVDFAARREHEAAVLPGGGGGGRSGHGHKVLW